jgi:hypothetical protein
MKILILFISIIFCLLSTHVYSEGSTNDCYVISPGIKLGYAFGNQGGFIYGFELTFGRLTLSAFPYPMFYGIVANLDFIKENTRASIAGEFQMWPFPGFTVGPALIKTNDFSEIGFTAGTYLSIGYLNLSYNYYLFKHSGNDLKSFPKLIDYNDITTQIKIPFTIPKFEIKF